MEGDVKKKQILIVEDSKVQSLTLKQVLLNKGFEVTSAGNGAEGLAMAQKIMPDLIISDIMMPVMDGYQMCREIKHSDRLKSIPVMLLTQLSDPEYIIKGLEAGAENYVTKPFNPEYFFSKVDSLITNPLLLRNNPNEKCIEIEYAGKSYVVRSGRVQTLNFLITTYENVLLQNLELTKAQKELHSLNEQLDEKVKERTEKLTYEVAERMAMEKALKWSEERFRAVAESASDAVICLEAPGNIYFWNGKAEEIFGYSSSEVIGKDLHSLIVPDRYRERAYKALQVFFGTGTGSILGKTVEMEAVKKDGTEFPVELSISAIKLHNVWNTVGIIRDITIRKKLESELKQKLSDLERMNKLMVGRELKMEELRAEIRALKKRMAEIEGEATQKTA